jgi:hypothetical protein
MLIDKENGNILARRQFVERSLYRGHLCLFGT